MYLRLRGDAVFPQLSSFELSSLDVHSRIEATSVHLPILCSSFHPLGLRRHSILVAALPGQAKHRGAEASFSHSRSPLSKSDSNARWSVTAIASLRSDARLHSSLPTDRSANFAVKLSVSSLGLISISNSVSSSVSVES